MDLSKEDWNNFEIEQLKEELEELEEEKEELEGQETNYAYDEMLDETKDQWIQSYDGGSVLREIDPTAYRCGLIDFNDERLTEIQNKIEEIKNSIKDLKTRQE